MNTDKGHPSRDELLAMAYADGELAPEARAEMDARLAREPELARLLVQYRRLELLSRHAAPPEPADHEWRRLARDPVQRVGLGLGLLMLLVGGLGIAGYAAYEIATSELAAAPKVLILLALGGLALLFLATLRGRLRTLPFDPYTEIQR